MQQLIRRSMFTAALFCGTFKAFAQPQLTATSTPAAVDNLSGGSIDLTISGGTGPYTCLWSPGGATTQDISGLSAGKYKVIVKDAANAVAQLEVEVPYRVQWTDLYACIVQGNDLVQARTDHNWFTGAASTNSISPGEDGWVEYKAAATNIHRTFGLSDVNTTPGLTDIDYGIYLRNDAVLIRINNGAQTSIGTYTTGDVLRVERRGSTIYYTKNGNVLSTLSVSPAVPLHAEATIYNIGARFENVLSSMPYTVSKGTTVASLSSGKNVTYSVTYDEYGKVTGEEVQYMDRLGRSTQNQQRNVSDNLSLVSQQVYDALGRAAIQTLPAPAGPHMNFKSGFITSSTGQAYSYSHFDVSANLNNPEGVQNTQAHSLGNYYSNNNSQEPFVAASAYPYGRTEFFADPLGRIKRTAAPGEQLRFGTNHEDRVFYMSAAGELAYVYGVNRSYITNASGNPEAADNLMACKTVSVNPDGLESITYTSSQGQVIASCLSGQSSGCLGTQKVSQSMKYYGNRGIDIHLPASRKTTLKLIIPPAAVSYGVTASHIVYAITDLNAGKVLVAGTDYTFDTGTRAVTFLGSYAGGSGFFRITYEYTPAYLTYYGGNYTPGYIPDLAVQYDLDYSDWTLNYYTRKGQLARTVSPKGIDCAYNPLDNPNFNTFVKLVPEASPTFHTSAIATVAGYEKAFKINIKPIYHDRSGGNDDTRTVHQTTSTLGFVLAEDRATDATEPRSLVASGSLENIPSGPNPTKSGSNEIEYKMTFNFYGKNGATSTLLNTSGAHVSSLVIKENIDSTGLNKWITWEEWKHKGLSLFFDHAKIGSYEEVVTELVSVQVSINKSAFQPFNSGNAQHAYLTEKFRLATTTVYDTYKVNSTGTNFYTRYAYHNLGWLVSKENPDEGRTDYVYNSEGQVRFWQQAEQRPTGRLSYINYDRAGRPLESGEYDPNISDVGNTFPAALFFETHAQHSAGPVNHPAGRICVHTITDQPDAVDDGRCLQQVYVSYDKAGTGFPAALGSAYKQTYLAARASKSWNSSSSSWYSYDELGRLRWTVQSISGIGDKTINYSYDLNGNVTEVAYQKENNSERLHHYYTYDGDKRLKQVLTSSNGGITKTIQAGYKYYKHGPLKREELGNLQGLDYVYTIQGWLKSMNAPSLDNRDPGKDNYTGENSGFIKDMFGTTLDYFNNDYVRANTFIQTYTAGTGNTVFPERFSGLVKAARWQTQMPSGQVNKFPGILMYAYGYDNLQRIKDGIFGTVSAGTLNGAGGGSGPAFTESTNYRLSGISYDLNGNLSSLQRNAHNASGNEGLSMDQLTYNYEANRNKLLQVHDAFATNNYTGLGVKPAQGTGNYSYDLNGRMKGNASESRYYDYDAMGRVIKVYSNASRTIPVVAYDYNERGQRTRKTTYITGSTSISKEVWYVRDAAGNELSTYERSNGAGAVTQTELAFYGSRRLGVLNKSSSLYVFEMADHLGNVRATFSRNRDMGVTTGFLGTGDEDQFFKFNSNLDNTVDISGGAGGSAKLVYPFQQYGTGITIPVTQGQVINTSIYFRHTAATAPVAALAFELKNAFGVVLDGYWGFIDGPANTWTFQTHSYTVDLAEQGMTLSIYPLNADESGVPAWFDNFAITVIPNANGEGGFDVAEQLSYTDYYPHGGIMPGRNVTGGIAYKYDYQGQLKDPETNTNGFELREYDGRLGRWLNPDPYGQHHSPYLAMSNNPVSFIDPDGGWDDGGGNSLLPRDASPRGPGLWGSSIMIDGERVNPYLARLYMRGADNISGVSTAGLRPGTLLGYSYNGTIYLGGNGYDRALQAKENAMRDWLASAGYIMVNGDYAVYNEAVYSNHGRMGGSAGVIDVSGLHAGDALSGNIGMQSGNSWIDNLQMALDVAGVADPTGVADATNAVISLFRGDLSGAAISTAAILPFGDLLKAGKYAAKGGSILADASKAAFNAADDVGSIFIKNKHLNMGSGNFAKFATSDIGTAQGWVQQALRSPNARFLPNPQIPNTFQVITNLGTSIGTKGQTSIRAIVGFDGKVINAFPVR